MHSCLCLFIDRANGLSAGSKFICSATQYGSQFIKPAFRMEAWLVSLSDTTIDACNNGLAIWNLGKCQKGRPLYGPLRMGHCVDKIIIIKSIWLFSKSNFMQVFLRIFALTSVSGSLQFPTDKSQWPTTKYTSALHLMKMQQLRIYSLSCHISLYTGAVKKSPLHSDCHKLPVAVAYCALKGQ